MLSTESCPVIADHGHRVEILLDNEALKACEGDFATFTALLEEKLRALQYAGTAAHNHPSGLPRRAPPRNSW